MLLSWNSGSGHTWGGATHALLHTTTANAAIKHMWREPDCQATSVFRHTIYLSIHLSIHLSIYLSLLTRCTLVTVKQKVWYRRITAAQQSTAVCQAGFNVSLQADISLLRRSKAGLWLRLPGWLSTHSQNKQPLLLQNNGMDRLDRWIRRSSSSGRVVNVKQTCFYFK